MHKMGLGLAMLAVGAAVPTAAMAGDLKPGQAYSTYLSETSIVTYFTREGDSFRVVVTAASHPDAQPVRYVTTLLPGQRSMVVIPRDANEPQAALAIARVGDRLVVENARTAITN